MTTTSSTTTYDPTSTAASLAKAYTDGRQTLLTQQTTDAGNTASALSKLQSALSTFDTSLMSLSTTSTSSVVAHSATFSDSSYGTASASSTAAPGSYSFFVQKIATASQASYAYGGGDAVPTASATGTINVNIGGNPGFDVDLSKADTNGDGVLSTTEVAAAINTATGNGGLVTASVVTVNGTSQLLLTSNKTGLANAASIDTSALAAGTPLKTGLDAVTPLTGAQDALVYLGGDPTTGIPLTQASNTFSNIAGVSVTFTKAMPAGSAAVTLNVATDNGGTAANVQNFVSAYNTLSKALDSLTTAGDPTNNVAAGIFSNDSGVRALRDKIASIVREQVGGVSLTSYGVTGNSDGTLSLDSTKLQAKVAANPDGLGAIFGSSMLGAKSGVLGDLDTALNAWTNSATGQISSRQNAVVKLQAQLAQRQTDIDNQYNSAYQRYLAQFTKLQALQAQMSQTTNMFDALFSSSGG
jgi:flagellar hook-associated protein 2